MLPLESGRDREFDSRVKFELVTKQGWKQWVGFNACYSQWPAALLNFIMDGPWEGADDIFIHFQFCRVFLREMRATYWTTGSEEVWNNYWHGFCQQMAERSLYRQPCLEWWDARGCGCSPATNSTRVAAAFLLPVRTHEDRE